MIQFTRLLAVFVVFISFCDVSSAENRIPADGLDIRCGETRVTVTVKRQFFKQRRVPFRPEFLRLGLSSSQRSSCGPERPVSDTEMVLSAGLQDCGTESRVGTPTESDRVCVWTLESWHCFTFSQKNAWAVVLLLLLLLLLNLDNNPIHWTMEYFNKSYVLCFYRPLVDKWHNYTFSNFESSWLFWD